MRHRHLWIVSIAMFSAAMAACGIGTVSPAPSATWSALPSLTRTAPTPGGEAIATLTLDNFAGEVDGPGGSVRDAIANAGVGLTLVNGILLKGVDGTVWLCDVLLKSSPPQCAEPRLVVVNWLPDDRTFVNGEGLHAVDGVRWRDQVQLIGVVSL